MNCVAGAAKHFSPRLLRCGRNPGWRLTVVLVLVVLLRPTLGLCASKPNILFIAADDLRSELGCYGVAQVKTPDIDRLATRGVVFTRAYCQQPLCGPTRASLLTGLRPDSTGVFHNNTHFREKNPAVVTLPQHFKNHGYQTMTTGKIFHGGKEDPVSWTETLQYTTLNKPYLPKPMGGYQLPENRRLWTQKAEAARKEGLSGEQLWGRLNGPATECADVPDQAYADGVTTDTAIAAIRRSKGKPFFLAAGFLKPHLWFIAPMETPQWRGAIAGGIWQPVRLIATGDVYVKDVFIEPKVSDNTATFHLELAHEGKKTPPPRSKLQSAPLASPIKPPRISARHWI